MLRCHDASMACQAGSRLGSKLTTAPVGVREKAGGSAAPAPPPVEGQGEEGAGLRANASSSALASVWRGGRTAEDGRKAMGEEERRAAVTAASAPHPVQLCAV